MPKADVDSSRRVGAISVMRIFSMRLGRSRTLSEPSSGRALSPYFLSLSFTNLHRLLILLLCLEKKFSKANRLLPPCFLNTCLVNHLQGRFRSLWHFRQLQTYFRLFSLKVKSPRTESRMKLIHLQGRLNQALGRDGIIPFPKVFASNRPFKAPLAGVTWHVIVTLIILLAPPSGDVSSCTYRL